MFWFWIILGIFLLLCALWLFLIAPNLQRQAALAPFLGIRYAHRGLHDATHAENSLSAFARAAESGFAIELDVRLSAEGELVVFHDDRLTRMCGIDRAVRDLTCGQLASVSLAGTGEGVPTFRDVLNLVAGRVPLLVEIKEDAGDEAVSRKTVQLLRDYTGAYLIESFNPLSLATVRRLLPQALRGQLNAHLSADPSRKKLSYRLTEHFLLNVAARPDFIAYEGRARSFLPFRVLRRLFCVATFAWTVRSGEEEEEYRKCGFDTVIFEGYLPESPFISK